MRISDWSSDVCSSDLLAHVETADEVGGHADAAEQRENMLRNQVVEHALAGNRPFFLCVEGGRVVLEILDQRPGLGAFIQDLGFAFIAQIGRASCRERVCQYVYISVVAVSLKKKNTKVQTLSIN